MHLFIPFNSDDEIGAIGNRLLNRTLPRSNWTHAAHFGVTLWLLTRHPEFDLSHEMPCVIRAYNEATGVPNTDTSGYHETITQASIRASRAFLAGRTPEPLFKICNALMASPMGKADWLLVYWSRSRLFSVDARRTWIEPDLHGFPF